MVTIAGFIIDATPVETHELSAETTEHPIEEGADVTDHVRILPDQITIEGVVSNTPVGTLAQTRANESPFAGEYLPADDALAYLRQIRENREPVKVETTIATYENMILVGLSIPQTSRSGDALRFRATFREIRIVKTERTRVKVSTPHAKGKRNRGRKPSPPVDEGSKLLQRQRQLNNRMRKNLGMTYDPTIGTDLL